MYVFNESKQCQLRLQMIWIAKFIKINVFQVDVTNASQQQTCSIWLSAHQYYEISSQSVFFLTNLLWTYKLIASSTISIASASIVNYYCIQHNVWKFVIKGKVI